jgi:hypothetical protein
MIDRHDYKPSDTHRSSWPPKGASAGKLVITGWRRIIVRRA